MTTEATLEQGAEAEQQPAGAEPTPAEPQEPQERPKTARELALESIEASRLAQLAEESGDAEAPEPPAEPAEPPAAEDTQEQLARQLADDERYVDADALRSKVKLKVDGEEKVVTVGDLVRIAQKHEAADRRLAEATQLLARARAEAQQPTHNAPLNATQTSPNVAPTTASPSTLEATALQAAVKDAVDAMYRGNESEAAEKLTATLLQIAQTAEDRAASRVKSTTPDEVLAQLEQRSALQGFFQAYPAVLQGSVVDGRAVEPEEMQSLADQLLPTFLAKGYSYSDALDRTGRAVYATHGLQMPRTAAEEPPATTRRQDVAQRKAQMDIPAGRMVSAAEAAEAPESSEAMRAKTIAEIAASRNPALRMR